MIDLKHIAKVLIDSGSASTRVIVILLDVIIEETLVLTLTYLPVMAPYTGNTTVYKQSENSHLEVSSCNEFSSTNVF